MPAILPRNEFGSASGSPGPVVAVCRSRLFGDIENVRVVPTATLFVAGKNAKISTPPAPLLPTWTSLAPIVGLCSALAVFIAAATCFLTRLASDFFDGALAVGATTWTFAFMPAWTLQ